jgi:molybdate-binding protein
MAKNSIVDTVADAVVRAELAVVRTGRQAVQAVNRKIGAGKRKVAGKKTAAKKAARKAVSRTKRTVRKVARKVASKTAKAAKRARRR